jgi:predicted alpha/beta-hydrolase family hydrolase
LQTKNNHVETQQTRVEFKSGGETKLVYCSPSNNENGLTGLIIAHGAGGPMYSPFIRYFHTELAKRGFLTAKFNFPYMEAGRKIPDKREILEEAYTTIVEQVRQSSYKPSSLFIGGKSMGGRIASQIAANGVEVDGLFFLGYPLHPPGRIDKLRDEHLFRIKKPMLFLSGTRDQFARRDLLEKVVSQMGSNAQIHWIQNGDHSFKTPGEKGIGKSSEEALGVLVEWLESHNPKT